MSAALAVPGIGRWFVRCLDCLSVSAVEDRAALPTATVNGTRFAVCGACGGTLETMGQVGRDHRLGFTYTESVCAAACTSAKGPSCGCVCGGKNHGTRRVRTVHVDRGPVPAVDPENLEKARATAEEYRAAVRAVLAAHAAKYADVMERKAAGWIPDFSLYLEARRAGYALAKARAGKTHAGRMKALRNLI